MYYDDAFTSKQRSSCTFNTPNYSHFTETNKLFGLKFSQNNNN